MQHYAWVMHPFPLKWWPYTWKTPRQSDSKRISGLSYSLPKHAAHPHCCQKDAYNNIDGWMLWQPALSSGVCLDLSHCVSTLLTLWLQAWKPLSMTWMLHSGSEGSQQPSWRGETSIMSMCQLICMTQSSVVSVGGFSPLTTPWPIFLRLPHTLQLPSMWVITPN